MREAVRGRGGLGVRWIGGPVGWMGRSFARAAIWTAVRLTAPSRWMNGSWQRDVGNPNSNL